MLAKIDSTIQEVIAQPDIPQATYRLQFHAGFTFQDATALSDYFADLGVSHCYASPILLARSGSLHGYDIADPERINPALGGEEAFDTFSAALRRRGLGLVIDIVPNHMGIGDIANQWWYDVLENGPSSPYAAIFDIEWQPVKPELANKVLLPILGDQYGRVLENGELKLTYDEGSFMLSYYEHHLPIAPGTYARILARPLDQLLEELDPDDPSVQEYQSILTAINYLPGRDETDPARLAERQREKEVIKRRIASLLRESPPLQAAVEQTVHALNGEPGNPRSFDALDDLIEHQAYRLAFWRVAGEEINYRRFFDINELAAIRTEDPYVFEATHRLIFRLLAERKASGLRIDHIDGLYDPTGYLRRLQERYLFTRVRAMLPEQENEPLDDEILARRISRALEQLEAEKAAPEGRPTPWPLYVVAEKILSESEPLPTWWVAHGTTGYEFLNKLNGLFVDTRHRERFDRIYETFAGMTRLFSELVNSKKKMIMLVAMASEIYTLSHRLERTAEKNRRYRDFTLDTLTFAIREVIASLQVYRTYVTDPESVTERDRQFIEEAIADARRRNPRTAAEVFDFMCDTLLLRNLADFQPEAREDLRGWVGRFQQMSGPVMAKGVEDTVFYIYNRLISLNEVGGHPNHFGTSPAGFHDHNAAMRRNWPHTMLASSTHDTKRSEDVRARINVLSELPDEWEAALRRWSELNAWAHSVVDRARAPDANDEYLLYQSLVGAWPYEPGNAEWLHSEEFASFRERIATYMQKATREAKERTSWVNPNQGYDNAVRTFVMQILDPKRSAVFLDDLRAFIRQIVPFGQVNSLAQTLLKLSSPGVPDIYQGNELWDLSLVDPDNRRLVDYQRRRSALAQIMAARADYGDDLRPLVRELRASANDGRIKLYLTQSVLSFRREHTNLFMHGDYTALEAVGERREHAVAFSRSYGNEHLVVVAPRLVVRLCDGATGMPIGPAWGNTWLALPDAAEGQHYRDLLTGTRLAVTRHDDLPGLPLATICAELPVALLERV